MARIALATMLVACIGFAAARGDEDAGTKEIKLEDLQMPVSSLSAWGVREYVYQLDRDGEIITVGEVTMRTEVEDERIVTHDTWSLQWRGKTLSADVKMGCARNSLLRPTVIRSAGEGDDELMTFTAEVGEDDAVVTDEDGAQKRIDFPSDTLADLAMFRIFTLLPREKNTIVRVGHVLEVTELNLKGPAVLLYAGKEEISLHGKQVPVHKFECKRDGRTVAEAWVDDEGVLRRHRMDGRKIITEAPNAPDKEQ
jgi:hypothetical protein